MAELATIGRPYAEALYEAAQAAGPGVAAAWGEKLSALAAVAADPEMRRFADNPKVTVEQAYQMIVGVSGASLSDDAGKGVSNFLYTVLENGRLAAFPEIAAQYHALVNASSGVADATIYSAYPIDQAELAGVMATLEQRFKRKLTPSVQVDPELIGGIRVVVGDEVLDTSVQGQLERMKVALTA